MWNDESDPLSYLQYNYENFGAGEPNNQGNEDCVQLYTDGEWNDLSCNTMNGFICKMKRSKYPSTYFYLFQFNYDNWSPGQPDNFGNEDCVQLYNTGLWNDLSCNTQNGFICKMKRSKALHTFCSDKSIGLLLLMVHNTNLDKNNQSSPKACVYLFCFILFFCVERFV